MKKIKFRCRTCFGPFFKITKMARTKRRRQCPGTFLKIENMVRTKQKDADDGLDHLGRKWSRPCLDLYFAMVMFWIFLASTDLFWNF